MTLELLLQSRLTPRLVWTRSKPSWEGPEGVFAAATLWPVMMSLPRYRYVGSIGVKKRGIKRVLDTVEERTDTSIVKPGTVVCYLPRYNLSAAIS